MKLLNFLIPVFEANERMERSLRQLKFMITQATDLNMFKVKMKENKKCYSLKIKVERLRLLVWR